MKMRKTKPIAKLMETCLINNPKQANNKLEHINYQPPQGILCPCTSGKKRCVDFEIQV
jgi:hypothetical protein